MNSLLQINPQLEQHQFSKFIRNNYSTFSSTLIDVPLIRHLLAEDIHKGTTICKCAFRIFDFQTTKMLCPKIDDWWSHSI